MPSIQPKQTDSNKPLALNGPDRLLTWYAILVAVAVLVGAAHVASNFANNNARAITTRLLSVDYLEGTSREAESRQIAEAFHIEPREKIRILERNVSKPLWIQLTPKSNNTLLGKEYVVELRNLRGTEFNFWIRSKLSRGQEGAMLLADLTEVTEQTLSGTVIRVPAQSVPYEIFGKINSTLPAKPKIFVWPGAEFSELSIRSTQFGGALFGIFLGLAAFSAVIAVLNRSITYLLFAGWLVTSLRLAAVNGGWTLNWLGISLPPTTTTSIMTGTLAAHGVLTVMLFLSLFESKIRHRPTLTLLKSASWGYAALIPLSLALSFGSFVKGFYSITAIGFIGLGLALAQILSRRPDATFYWYALSFLVMTFGLAGEMLYQIEYFQAIAGFFNAQVAAVVSALTLGVALAEQMRTERQARLAARARETKALQKVEENYQATPIALFTLDESYCIRMVNDAFVSLFMIGNHDIATGRTLDDFCGVGTTSRLRLQLSNESVCELEVCAVRNGEAAWYSVRLSAAQGQLDGSIQEVTARKIAEGKLQHLVTHDALTGLLNRRGYDELLTELLNDVTVEEPLLLAEIAIDHFDELNALHGSQAIDGVFKNYAEILHRYSAELNIAKVGDSFRIIAKGMSVDVGTRLAERLQRSLANSLTEKRTFIRGITTSIGLVEVCQAIDAGRAQTYVAHACVMAKKSGRGRVVILSQEDQALRDHFEMLRVAETLENNLMNGRFFTVFQPIVDLHNPTAPINFEVLLRMRGATDEIITPNRFIPAAEQSGLMSEIDRWVLSSTFEVLRDNPVICNAAGYFTINLSGASLNDPTFLEDLFALATDNQQLITKVCFEVTESVALHDTSETRNFLEQLRLLGAKVALDDFGQGYTSWNYLKTLPADILKIDGSIVRDVADNRTNAVIVKSIRELAHELGMRCVAEWIEDKAAIDACAALGVDLGQGWGFAEALPLHRLVAAGDNLHSLLKTQPAGKSTAGQTTKTTELAESRA